MHTELRDFLNSKPLIDPTSKALTYGDGPSGSMSLRQTLATFLNDYFHPIRPVQAGHLMVTNGVTSAIEHASWALANSGEGILLGRPYYRAFIPDIGLRFGVKVVPVSFGSSDPFALESVPKYEEALLESERNGVKVRALMLCHPHNPLGRCYPKAVLIAFMHLCQKHQIHLISDEIYALSVWKNNIDTLEHDPPTFESILSIDSTGIIDPGLIHALWGTSKDFGANGIRIGAIISQANESFLTACRTCSLYSSPSSLAESAALEIFNDRTFAENYIKNNQDRLSDAYSHAVTLTRKYGIPHKLGVNAAFFLWIDLGTKYLERHAEVGKENPHALTDMIYQKLMEKRVFIVSGDVAGAEEPGWFRLVFSQPKDLVENGMRRIAEALE